MTTKPRRAHIVCWYRGASLVRESLPLTAQEAHMEAMYASRDGVDAGLDVTIYCGDRALRDWDRVSVSEVRRRFESLQC